MSNEVGTRDTAAAPGTGQPHTTEHDDGPDTTDQKPVRYALQDDEEKEAEAYTKATDRLLKGAGVAVLAAAAAKFAQTPGLDLLWWSCLWITAGILTVGAAVMVVFWFASIASGFRNWIGQGKIREWIFTVIATAFVLIIVFAFVAAADITIRSFSSAAVEQMNEGQSQAPSSE